MHYHAARLYFTEEASYRAVGRQLNITPLTAFRWIDSLGRECKGFKEVAEELKPRWGGYFLADGKAIFIKGKKYALLLTADVQTQDIPMVQLFRSENRVGWESVFLPLLDRIPYPLRCLIIDGDLGLWAALRRIFPSVPVQLCVRHVENFLNYYFRYQYKGSGKCVKKFLKMVRDILYAPDTEQWHQRIDLFKSRSNVWKSCGLEAEYLSFLE